jgi:hypothetical protein
MRHKTQLHLTITDEMFVKSFPHQQRKETVIFDALTKKLNTLQQSIIKSCHTDKNKVCFVDASVYKVSSSVRLL